MAYGYTPRVADYSYIPQTFQNAAQAINSIPDKVRQAKVKKEYLRSKEEARKNLKNDRAALTNRYATVVKDTMARLEQSGMSQQQAKKLVMQHMYPVTSYDVKNPDQFVERITTSALKLQAKAEATEFGKFAKGTTQTPSEMTPQQLETMPMDRLQTMAQKGEATTKPGYREMREKMWDLSPEARKQVAPMVGLAKEEAAEKAVSAAAKEDTQIDALDAYVQAGGDRESGMELARLVNEMSSSDLQASVMSDLAQSKYSLEEKKQSARNIAWAEKQLNVAHKQDMDASAKLDQLLRLRTRVPKMEDDHTLFKDLEELGITGLNSESGKEQVKAAIKKQELEYKRQQRNAQLQMKKFDATLTEMQKGLKESLDITRASRAGEQAVEQWKQEHVQRVVNSLQTKFGNNYDNEGVWEYLNQIAKQTNLDTDVTHEAYLLWKQGRGAQGGASSTSGAGGKVVRPTEQQYQLARQAMNDPNASFNDKQIAQRIIKAYGAEGRAGRREAVSEGVSGAGILGAM